MRKNSQHPIMKRPLPPSSSSRRGGAASALLLLLRPDRARPSPASAARALKTSRKGINHREECVPLLHKAVTYDGDGSGGLDSAEFSEFWTDGLTVPGTADDGTSLYETLLCECYYSFDLGWGCCRDYAGASSGEDPEDAEGQQRWVEISLTQFGEGDPGPWEKHYHKRFCKKVNDNMKWEGIALKDVIAGWTFNTTEAPVTTTTGTTTAEEAATTEEPEPAATTTAATATVTTAAATTEETVATDATPTIETAATSTTAAATTTTEATATTATEPSATTTTAAAADAAATAAPEEAAEPIVLSFVGSTNGNIDADTASQEFLDEVSHAFWKVSLDVLEDMGVAEDRKRHLAEGGALQYVYKSRGPRRHLNSGLGDEFAVYFKSMNTNVENEAPGCPGEIAYAAEGAPCLRFRFTLARRPSGPLTEDLAAEFADRVESAVDGDGALFDALVKLYPDTEVVGMGAPGSGAPYSDPANAQVVLLNEADDAGAKEVAAAGFPVGGAAGGIAAAALVVALVAGFAFKRRRNRQRERKEQLNDSNLSEDAEANEVNADADRVEDWLDGESDDGRDRGGGEQRPRNPMSPASSLAAMGVASTVATRLTTGDTEVMLSSRTAWSKKEPVV